MIQLPSEEDVARVLVEFQFPGCGDDAASVESHFPMARAVLDLFAPILAEKERNIREAVAHASEGWRRAGLAQGKLEASELAGVVDGWKARALAAEAALDAERERCAKVVEGWAEEHAAHLADDAPSPIGRHRAAMNDGYALAAAIRAQGG